MIYVTQKRYQILRLHNDCGPTYDGQLVWFGLLRIYVALAVFQLYRDLEAGDNQSLKIQVARRGIEPRTSCSASQELNHSATAAPMVSWHNDSQPTGVIKTIYMIPIFQLTAKAV